MKNIKQVGLIDNRPVIMKQINKAEARKRYIHDKNIYLQINGLPPFSEYSQLQKRMRNELDFTFEQVCTNFLFWKSRGPRSYIQFYRSVPL